ncbi:MAG TPA: hypothetical protein VFW42_05480 [Fluviicoccus sp.]|nr:hypothetical protein [Fluviicoccus sp.]
MIMGAWGIAAGRLSPGSTITVAADEAPGALIVTPAFDGCGDGACTGFTGGAT